MSLNGFNFTHIIFFPLFIFLITAHACTIFDVSEKFYGETCLEFEIERLDNLPKRQFLRTLDGQEINLDEFFSMSFFLQPGCSLPHKFYYWHNEVKEIYSRALEKEVKHKIRAYYSLMSTCYPEKIDDGRIYGDVAEFYNEEGIFMGFSVYIGHGLYCPLPYSGYKEQFKRTGIKLLVNA
jgi:hypothetical protein